MIHNSNGYKISPTQAQQIFDNRFFPITGRADFPYLSDLLGSDWGSIQNCDARLAATLYRIEAQAALKRIYG